MHNKKNTPTAAGTRECSFRSFSTAAPPMPWLCSYMASHTALTQTLHFTLSICTRDTHCDISQGISMLGMWSIGIRHWRQGQWPRLQSLTIIILRHIWVFDISAVVEYLLLLVICRISEYMWVKAVQLVITTFNHHFMLVCFQKVIVEDDGPLSMVHFSIAMAGEDGSRFWHAKILGCNGCKCIR